MGRVQRDPDVQTAFLSKAGQHICESSLLSSFKTLVLAHQPRGDGTNTLPDRWVVVRRRSYGCECAQGIIVESLVR